MGVLGMVSMLWSGMPSHTLIRSASFLLAVLSTMSIIRFSIRANQIDTKSIIDAYQWSNFLILLFFFCYAVAYPLYGFRYNGRLGGAMIHPNTLGAFASISILVSSVSLMINRKFAFNSVLLILISAICLFLCHSRSSILLSCLCISLSYIEHVGTQKKSVAVRGVLYVLFFAILAGAIIFAIIQGNAVLSFMMRGNSAEDLMSGSSRSYIWAKIFSGLKFDFVLGHGFATISEHGTISEGALTTFHSHNGYVQTIAGLGIVGIFLVINLILKILLSKRSIRLFAPQNSIIFSGVFYFFLLHNLAQSSLCFQIYPQLFAFLLLYNAFFMKAEITKRVNRYWAPGNP